MAKIPVVNSDMCIGCGTCVALCPAVFKMNTEGKSEVANAIGASEEEIEKAINGCPSVAISWQE